MNWLNPALIWFLVGAALLLIELATYGFLAIFFTVGAWITAILLWANIIEDLTLSLTIFLIASVVTLIFFRRKLKAVIQGTVEQQANTDELLDDFRGKFAKVVEAIDPKSQTGKIEFRGSYWDASSDNFIDINQTVEILSRNNLTLKVKLQNKEKE